MVDMILKQQTGHGQLHLPGINTRTNGKDHLVDFI